MFKRQGATSKNQNYKGLQVPAQQYSYCCVGTWKNLCLGFPENRALAQKHIGISYIVYDF
jgi:hypothetical protein